MSIDADGHVGQEETSTASTAEPVSDTSVPRLLVSERDLSRIADVLDNPPEPPPALHKAFRAYAGR